MASVNTAFIVISIILFFAFFCIIWWPGTRKRWALFATLIEFLALMSAMAAAPARDNPGGSWGMGVLSVLLMLAGIGVYGYYLYKKRKAKSLRIGGTKLDRFYVECVLADADDFTKPKNVERAKLIAQDCGVLIGSDGIEALYEKGRAHHALVTQQFHKEHREEYLNGLKKEEEARAAQLQRYSELIGRAKSAAILSDLQQLHLKAAQKAANEADYVWRRSQQSEHSWSILGGIADGIAGPAAGVAVALDAQRENAEIRRMNEIRGNLVMPVYAQKAQTNAAERRAAEYAATELKALQTKLFTEDDPAGMFEKLSFADTAVTVSDTGTCDVTTRISAPENFVIFDDVPARIDGTVLARICDGDRVIGEAKLVFPKGGVRGDENLEGICLYCGEPKKKYTVAFAPYHLWGAEA